MRSTSKWKPISSLYLLVVSWLGCAGLPLRAAETASSESFGQWRGDIQETFHLPAELPPLRPQFHGRFEAEPGITVERWSFDTLYGMRIPAIVYRPTQIPAKAPGLIVVNGHGGDKYSWYANYAGILFARGGAVVLTYDPLGEGERNPGRRSGTRAHDHLKPANLELGCYMAGQMVADLRQAVRFLAIRPDVDPARIGAMGYSLGSVVLGFAGALEPRLAAEALVGGGNWDPPGGVWDNAKPLCAGYPFQALRPLGDLPAILYALRAQHGPTLVYNGLADEVVQIPANAPEFFADLQRRTAELIGSETAPFEIGFLKGTSHRPYFVTRPVVQWLDKQIDLPNWTAREIETMPTSRIGDWAKAKGVEVDRYYATEAREDGTLALGQDIPGLTREQLSVFTPEAWQATQSRLSIDVWHQRVSSLINHHMPARVTLASNGTPMATIVVGADATTAEKAAASELRQYLMRSTGAAFSVAHEGPHPRILVGASALPKTDRARIEALAPDGFLIESTTAGDLLLAGNGRQGTAFAVYAFLEQFVGARWLWPGPLGEVVPTHRDLAVEATWQVQEPAFRWRDLGPGGPLWGRRGSDEGKGWDKWEAERQLGVTREHQRQQAEWEMHNRFGGIKTYGGHAFADILPPAKYGNEHPEYFAMVNGKRDADGKRFDGKHGCQPCTTHPDVIRITVDYINRFFAEHPQYDAFSIGLNDGSAFCECEHCRELDSGQSVFGEADVELGKGGRQRALTDRVLTFANTVAKEVMRTHPEKQLILYAYAQYKEPPSRVQPAPNLIIQYTLQTGRHLDREVAEEDFARLSRWCKSGAEKLAIYDYFIQGGWPDLPRLTPALVEETVRRSQGLSTRYFQTQHGSGYALNGLNYYLLGKLLWDPSLEAGQIRREYIAAGFGRAAVAVTQYYDLLESRFTGSDSGLLLERVEPGQYRAVVAMFPPEVLAQGRRHLNEAHRLAEGDERRRVEFLQQGLGYLERMTAAAEASLVLLEAGWRLKGTVVPPEHADMAAFDRALAAWRARREYVDSLTNDWVLAVMWIKYNAAYRNWDPLAAMERYHSRRAPGEKPN
ncbi:MAG: DUF4838 domain-containing protein [Pirellulales bacterium]|nr:DUF4838 domain-containing protein [Pirellulales bacterium]